jgi:hypothetical protein
MNSTRELALALFLTYAIILKPRLRTSLKAVLPVYRKIIRPLPGPLPRHLARAVLEKTGLDDDEPVILGPEQKSVVKFPEILWRDPRPNLKQGRLRHRVRKARGRTISQEAAAQRLLPSELEEMERGCAPRAGLTTTHGAEPLCTALLNWATQQRLTGNQHFRAYSLNWALEVLRYWPPHRGTDVLPIDQGLIMVPRPRVPTWQAPFQPWPEYLKSIEKDPGLLKYRDDMQRLINLVPAKRGPGKKRGGSQYRHFQWLAGYQVCGWSENAIAGAAEIWPTSVSRDLHRLAKSVGLTMRPGAENDRRWTAERIRAVLVPA